MSLQRKAVSGTLWSGADMFARKSVHFAISLVLARLLTPEDYGTVGLLSIFIALGAVFIDSGFFRALIQRKEVSIADLSSVFYFNLLISLCVAAILCLAVPWIVAFYRNPVLKPLMWVLAANLGLGSLGSIQTVLLSRSLNFRRQCIISVTALVVSGAVAIILAWQGYGVWSLATQSLSGTFITVLLLWVCSSWRPAWVFSLASIRSLFRFGGFVLLTVLMDTFFTRLNTLVIGKLYSPKDLGYYSRADSTSIMPGDVTSGIIGRVAFPVFAAAQHDRALLKSGLRRAIITTMMFNIPMMFGMAISARPLVLVLFGAQWLPCVPYIQILCLAYLWVPLHMLNLNILLAQGHSNLFFRLEMIKKAVGILLMVSACSFGLTAIAWSYALTGVIWFGINAHYSGRLLDYGFLRQITELLPYFGVALVMTIGVWTFSLLPLSSPALLLAGQVLVGAVLYATLCFGLRLNGFVSTWMMLRPVLAGHLQSTKAWLRVRLAVL